MSTKPNSLVTPIKEGPDIVDGLTKRELFAIHAMQALIADDKDYNARAPKLQSDKQLVANKAVNYADALIQELNRHS